MGTVLQSDGRIYGTMLQCIRSDVGTYDGVWDDHLLPLFLNQFDTYYLLPQRRGRGFILLCVERLSIQTCIAVGLSCCLQLAVAPSTL